MECNKPHRYDSVFEELPENQGGEGRHLCAGCAYDEGYKDGLEEREKRSLSELNLPKSQAGQVRHKDAQAAYDLGYEKGQEDRNTY